MRFWSTVIHFVYKLSLNYRSFKPIFGCPLDSSSSRTARQHTQCAAHKMGCGPTVQISSQKTSSLQIRQIKTQWTIACGVQCWRLTPSLKQSRKQSLKSRKRFRLSGTTCHKDGCQGCKRRLKLKDWKLVLELAAGGGHFEHSQWQWNFSIKCVVSMMLLNWCCRWTF